MRIRVVGCGDAFGSGGRFNAATLIEAGQRLCLVDCGATTMTALNAQNINPDAIDLIVLTHLHGDHFGGVPFLLLDAQWVRRRRRPITVIGPPGTRQRLKLALDVLFDGSAATPWTFEWSVQELEPSASTSHAGFLVTSALVSHPSGAPATAVRISAGGNTFVHSGDTEWTDVLPRLAAGADLVFLECFACEPTPTHMDYQTLAGKRHLFDAPHVVLTHMGPDMLAARHKVDRSLYDLADDGQLIDIGSCIAGLRRVGT